ncbi:MAG: TetR/AcrR family transcriptional regulator [Geodermatophilaceae bacterium]|nr:TetR/AcrR family transcriptional regulator [Geodermatophilaceae bacterium]
MARTTGSRRGTQRAALVLDIRRSARELLAAEGKAGVTLRPIAKAVGLTAPALYRYYDSRESLLLDLVADLYDELAETMERARDEHPAEDFPARFGALVWAFREWSCAHPHEFELVFATPVDLSGVEEESRLEACTERFGAAFYGLFLQLWAAAPFPVPADEDIDPTLLEQLRTWKADEDPLPLGALSVYVSCWVRIYGLISLEVFGQLRFALTDIGPMYHLMLTDLGTVLGLKTAPHPAASPEDGG